MPCRPGATYLSTTAPASSAGDQHEQATEDYNQTGAVPYVQRTPEEIASFFDGLELIEPGCGLLPAMAAPKPRKTVRLPKWTPSAGVARKPKGVQAAGAGRTAGAQDPADSRLAGVVAEADQARRTLGGISTRGSSPPTAAPGHRPPG